MKNTVHVEGLRELEAALSELPRATGKNVVRRVLLKRAQPVADQMRSAAPREFGNLQTSIGVSTKLSNRQKRQHRKMKADVEVFIGAGALPQAHLQEFGTFKEPPQPFARPAWDASKNSVLDGIGKDLWAEIEKAAARLARKTARLAKG
jgi:HK97 gp10 family phage protein